MSLSEKKLECLSGLKAWDGEWVRPMDVGGRDASHHAATLRQLALAGLAECRRRGMNKVLTIDELKALKGRFGRRGRGMPKLYRITEAGRAALSAETSDA